MNKNKIALITGVTGQDGAYLSELLLDKGYEVHGLGKAQNFQRSDRKLGRLYVLTPQGVRHRLQLTHAFLACKEQESEALQSQSVLFREELARGQA